VQQRGSAGGKFAVVMVLLMSLVFGTVYLIRYHYDNDWARTDPRGAAGRRQLMGPPPAEGGGQESPEPQATPPPPFKEVAKTSAKK
jgi:hypothetical protein